MFNFRKIASTAASVALVGSTIALAAAASYPAPFVSGGSADVGIVYGSSGASSDLVAATDIRINLENALRSQGGSSGTPTGGDFVQLDKGSTDRVNMGDSVSAVFVSNVDDSDLPSTLADGVYTADDKDDFDFEQRIALGSNLVLSHFQEADYEDLIGVNEDTPTVGFNISSDAHILNYTLNFLDDPESDIVSGDLDDIEGSDLVLMGKTYFVQDAKNGTDANVLGKFTLLDSANTATVSEGETINLDVGGENYEVSIGGFIDSDSVVLKINGENTDDLTVGQSEKLSDGSYVSIRSVRKLEVAGELGSAEFSIGSGKLEITSGSEIQLNDDPVDNVRGYIFRGSPSGDAEKISKIVLEWDASDNVYITPDADLTMPGFETVKFSMNDLMRSDEEEITVKNDGTDKIELRIPVEDGNAVVPLLYGNSSGEFAGIGESATRRLATSANNTLLYQEKTGSARYHDKVVVSYNVSGEAESYVLSFDIKEDGDTRNETSVTNEVTGEQIESGLTDGDSFEIGSVSLSVTDIGKTSSEEWVELTAGSNVNFNTIYSKGGMKVWLPIEDSTITVATTSFTNGLVSFADADVSTNTTGHNSDQYYVYFKGENKDDDIASGTQFYLTLNDNSDSELEVSQVDGSSNGGPGAHEIDNTDVYEKYILDDVAPRILHTVQSNGQSEVSVMYPEGKSQTYAEVFLSEVGVSSSTGTSLGSVVVMDSEVSQVSADNLIVVGGSCVNSVASTLLSNAGCGASWQSATGVGAGSFLIQSFASPYSGSKVATLVAGYNSADTTNAASYLTNSANTVDTSAGKKYIGTDASTATLA